MKAITIPHPGPADVLKYTVVPVPKRKPSEVLLKVAGSGVNRPDIAQRLGNYPPPDGAPADIPGLEVSGVVEEGDDNGRFKPGDKVCALLSGGGYAEYVTAEAELCLTIPDNIAVEDGAALPETFFTVWNNVFKIGGFQSGMEVLVHGGSSGIGVACIQMVKALGGKVYTTAGSKEKCDYCLSLGASTAINYHQQDFEQVLGKNSIDLVLDMVGGSYTNKNIAVARPGAKIIMINSMQSRMAEVDLMKLMVKQIVLTGSTLRSQPLDYKARLARGLKESVWPKLASGEIKPIIFRKFPLSKAVEAHKLMESSHHIGKIILLPHM